MFSISGSSRTGLPQNYNNQNVLMSVSDLKDRLDTGTAQKNDSSIIATIWNMIKEFFNGTNEDKFCGTFCDIFNFDIKNDECRAQAVLEFMPSLKAELRQQLVWKATNGINGNPPTFSVSLELSDRTFRSPEIKFDALAKAYNNLTYDRGYFYDTRNKWAESLYGDINNAEVYEKLAEFFSDNAHDKENLASLLDLIKDITKKVPLTESDELLFNKIIDRHVNKVIFSETHSTESNNTLANDVINCISAGINLINPTTLLENLSGTRLSAKPITHPEKINHSLAKFFLDIITTSENPELALKNMEKLLKKYSFTKEGYEKLDSFTKEAYEKFVSTYEHIVTELCTDTYRNKLPYYIGYNNQEIVKEMIFIQLLTSGNRKMLENLDDQLSGLQYQKDAHLFLKKLPKTYPELLQKPRLSYYDQKLLNFLEKNPDCRRAEASNLLADFATGVATGFLAGLDAFVPDD